MDIVFLRLQMFLVHHKIMNWLFLGGKKKYLNHSNYILGAHKIIFIIHTCYTFNTCYLGMDEWILGNINW